MEASVFSAILFTVFQISWALVWAAKHTQARRSRRYAVNRIPAETNGRYKVVSYFLYVSQNIICIASFWSNAELLIKIHDSSSMRIAGVVLISFATLLYFKSLRRLGRNYSPCFDSHVPFELINSGPFKFIRHPMYLGKLMLVMGNFILSGSLWFLPVFLYLMLETISTIDKEEKYLATSIRGYVDYQKRTNRILPFVF